MTLVAISGLLLATACLAAEPCEDSLDWTAGKHVPFDNVTLQSSISHIGNVKRFQAFLRKLDGGTDTAKILVVGGSFTHGGGLSRERVCSNCLGRLWQDVFVSWLRKTFPAEVRVKELHISGALSNHLQEIPQTAEAFLPDLVLVETSLSPLMQPGQSPPSEQTGRYLIDEAFMRSLLQVSNLPAIVFLELMAAPPFVTNEMTDLLLTEYYDIPQVSIKTAWEDRMPFNSSEIWSENPLKMTALGHKLVAVTLANFMCFELKHTCNSSGVASKVLPKPLFSPQREDEEEQAFDAADSMMMGNDLQLLDFCTTTTTTPAPKAVAGTSDTPWSAIVFLALITILLVGLGAFFVMLYRRRQKNKSAPPEGRESEGSPLNHDNENEDYEDSEYEGFRGKRTVRMRG